VEKVLKEDGYHGVRSNSGVEGGQTHPQSQEAFVLDALGETVEEALVRKFSSRVCIDEFLLGFILRILVLTLSKGRAMKDTATPEMADAASRMFMVSFLASRCFISCSLDSL
jgi:hypothetical protein